jgi:chaperone required for assembly of F1-ATPase
MTVTSAKPGMKRFYTMVTVHSIGPLFEIHLDGKPIRTPGGLKLAAPTEGMANAIMTEWAGQGAEIVPDSMPLTQILATAIERVGEFRDDMTHALLAYLNTDLICYRTDNEEIAARQAAAWDPWLVWFGERYDSGLVVTDFIKAITQPHETQDAVRDALEAMDDYRFAVLQLVTSLTGSLVFGLAFDEGAMSPEEAFDAANVDEIYKAKIYNEDVHGKAPNEELRERAMKRDLAASRAFLNLLGND